MEHEHGRRREDPFEELYRRIAGLERDVTSLNNQVGTMKLEQTHMVALFTARFLTVEKSNDLLLSEMRALNNQFQTMASEPDKSPAGRALLARIDEAEDLKKQLTDMKAQLDQIIGGLLLMKTVGFSGLISGVAALVWVAMRSFGLAQ